jgi:pimeloyl-ACP methyl ester carboxylesterase
MRHHPALPFTTRLASLLCLSLWLGGCAFWRPVTVPLQQASYPAPCARPADAPRPLIVLMPGRFMRIEEFAEQGFVDAVRRRGIDADVLLVDTHLGYYIDHTVLDRLQADVFEPARRRGVTQVWLAGVSLGAFGAMLYSDGHPGQVAGIVALGPYLGGERAVDRVRAAGGLRQWTWPADQPATGPIANEDAADLRVWGWLQAQTATPRAAGVPPLWLGYGADDRFLETHRMLAAAMPGDRVTTRPGGHDWDAWKPLWGDALDRLPLPRRAACASGRVALRERE